MALAAGDPPAVARQHVRRALRKFRDGTPLSQGDVARKLGWSLSKMQRIEAGDVGVSPTDLRALLDLYEVTDPAVVEQLMQDARISRRQRYETSAEHRAHLTPALIELMQFERRASAIRIYQSTFLPGNLQTPAIARAVLGFAPAVVDDDARRVRYEVRLQRAEWLQREDGAEYFVILDESVLKRRVGSDDEMAEQLEFLAAVAQRSKVHIRIVPLAGGARLGMLGPFWMVDLSQRSDDSVLYRETYTRDELVHDPDEVQFHRQVFEDAWQVAQSEEKTRRAIVAEAAVLRAGSDDP